MIEPQNTSTYSNGTDAIAIAGNEPEQFITQPEEFCAYTASDVAMFCGYTPPSGQIANEVAMFLGYSGGATHAQRSQWPTKRYSAKPGDTPAAELEVPCKVRTNEPPGGSKTLDSRTPGLHVEIQNSMPASSPKSPGHKKGGLESLALEHLDTNNVRKIKRIGKCDGLNVLENSSHEEKPAGEAAFNFDMLFDSEKAGSIIFTQDEIQCAQHIARVER